MNLFDRHGNAVAYIDENQHNAIFLWGGSHVGVLVEDQHIFGTNGKHLGWFVNGVVYDETGHRIGFTESTCPIPVSKITPRWKQCPREEAMPNEKIPPTPHLTTHFSRQDFLDFLVAGEISPFER
jgi:hypothetical protein